MRIELEALSRREGVPRAGTTGSLLPKSRAQPRDLVLTRRSRRSLEARVRIELEALSRREGVPAGRDDWEPAAEIPSAAEGSRTHQEVAEKFGGAGENRTHA